MSASIIYWSASAAQVMLALSMILTCYRLIRGPRAQDRVLAIDILFSLAMLMMLVLGIKTGSPHFFPIALILAGVGFVSSVALAKFLMRGEIIECRSELQVCYNNPVWQDIRTGNGIHKGASSLIFPIMDTVIRLYVLVDQGLS